MRKTALWAAILGAALVNSTGCGDGGTGSGGAGAGGTGGTGGETTTSTGGSAGTGGAKDLTNGCDPATAEDHSADATTTVITSGLTYTPPCITIKPGASVKFQATFSIHPLVGGEVVDGTPTPDAKSPIAMTSDGSEATFTFPAAGTFPYYCSEHYASGMQGVVFVAE